MTRRREGRKGGNVGLWNLWERGRLARISALARDTLILAFSREGRRDPMAAVWAWFWVAGLASTVWIPAFAGMTGREGLTGFRF